MTYTKKRTVINIRYRFITFMVIAMILFNLLLFGFIIPNITKADVELSSVSVVVCSGDTLWSIASEYGNNPENMRQTVYEIKKANNLKSSELKVGQTLIIPIKWILSII